MAHCFQCGQEIGYLSMFTGILSKYGRNLWRGGLQVFECPHCDTECQEHWITSIGFVAFMLLGVFVLAGFLRRLGPSVIGSTEFFLLFMALFFWLHSLWWRHVSTTKEPFNLPWDS